MSDVFKNIADAVDSNSVRRGFSDLFTASKAALDRLQSGLAGALPSVPGMPVAKFGDLSVGNRHAPHGHAAFPRHARAARGQGVRPHGRPHGKPGNCHPPVRGRRGRRGGQHTQGHGPVREGARPVDRPGGHRHRAPAGLRPAFRPAGQRHVRVRDVDGQLDGTGGRRPLFRPDASGPLLQHSGNTDRPPQGQAQEGKQGADGPHLHAVHHHFGGQAGACRRPAHHRHVRPGHEIRPQGTG